MAERARRDMFGDHASASAFAGLGVCVRRVPIYWKMKVRSCLPMIVAEFQRHLVFEAKPITKRLCLRLKIRYFLFSSTAFAAPSSLWPFHLGKKWVFFFPLAFYSIKTEEFTLFQYHFMLNFQWKG